MGAFGMTNFKGNYFRYILFILLLVFASTTNSALALSQLQNPTFNGRNNNITNWTNRQQTATISSTNPGLNINYSSNNDANYTGFIAQTFKTPANQINALFTWGAWSYTNAQAGGGGNSYCNNPSSRIFYGTNNNNDSNGGAYLVNNTSNNANGTAGSLLVTNLNRNTTYYAKVYAYATLRRRSFSFKLASFQVNFSPSGLTGNFDASPNLRTINIGGTNYNIYDGGKINLSWDVSTSNAVTFNHYTVYRSDSENGTYEPIATINNQNTTTYEDATPLDGENWYYITDSDSAGVESPASLKVRVNNVTVKNFSAQVVWADYWAYNTFNWDTIAGYWQNYYVFWGRSSGNYEGVREYGNPTNARHEGPQDDTTYYYTITYNYNNQDKAPLSEEASVYVLYPPNVAESSGYIRTDIDPVTGKDAIIFKWDKKTLNNDAANPETHIVYSTSH